MNLIMAENLKKPLEFKEVNFPYFPLLQLHPADLQLMVLLPFCLNF